MRNAWKAIAWVGLGIVLGALAAGLAARRLSVTWYRDVAYADEVHRAAFVGEALRLLDHDVEQARGTLERDLERALAAAENLAAEGAYGPLLSLLPGDLLQGLASAESYALAHHLDPAVPARAARLRREICGRMSPNSKYRGGCD